MSCNREIYSDLKVTQALIPAVRTADANGVTIDTIGYDSLLLVANAGNSADTLSGTVLFEFEVEESDDDSTWTDVADANLTNYVAGTNDGCFAFVDAPSEDSRTFITGYKGSKRYVRVVYNVTGTHSTGTPVGAIAIQGHASRTPVNASV